MVRKTSIRATQVDIARTAGVSQATVSLVLNEPAHDSQVSGETRERVVQAMQDLGYVANAAARSLKLGRNHIIGLHTFESVFPVSQRDFYFPLLLAVEEQAAALGYDLLLFSSMTKGRAGGDTSRVTGLRSSFGADRLALADGCVLLGRHVRRRDVEDLVRDDFPVVFVGRREVAGSRLSYVSPDYLTSSRAMVEQVLAAGHRQILMVTPRDGSEPTRDRRAGVQLGLAQAELPASTIRAEKVSSVDELTGSWLRARVAEGCTAIMVEPSDDDRTGHALTAAAAELGLEIPTDLSVVFLGDTAVDDPRDWTRFSVPRRDIGRHAVRLLIDRLEFDDTQVRQVLLPCPSRPGDSLAAPPRRGAR